MIARAERSPPSRFRVEVGNLGVVGKYSSLVTARLGVSNKSDFKSTSQHLSRDFARVGWRVVIAEYLSQTDRIQLYQPYY